MKQFQSIKRHVKVEAKVFAVYLLLSNSQSTSQLAEWSSVHWAVCQLAEQLIRWLGSLSDGWAVCQLDGWAVCQLAEQSVRWLGSLSARWLVSLSDG
jgi:hypothetical protein